MSETLKGVVVSHAALAEGLVEAVRLITGDGEALVPVSNDGCDSGALQRRLAAAVGAEPAVVFVDLPGGSCLHAAVRQMKAQSRVAVGAAAKRRLLLELH